MGGITEGYDQSHLHELYDIATLKSQSFHTTSDLQLFPKCNKINTCLNIYFEYDAYPRENGIKREYSG